MTSKGLEQVFKIQFRPAPMRRVFIGVDEIRIYDRSKALVGRWSKDQSDYSGSFFDQDALKQLAYELAVKTLHPTIRSNNAHRYKIVIESWVEKEDVLQILKDPEIKAELCRVAENKEIAKIKMEEISTGAIEIYTVEHPFRISSVETFGHSNNPLLSSTRVKLQEKYTNQAQQLGHAELVGDLITVRLAGGWTLVEASSSTIDQEEFKARVMSRLEHNASFAQSFLTMLGE